MQLWQKLILIPLSIAICERGFSNKNAIKTKSVSFEMNWPQTYMGSNLWMEKRYTRLQYF